MIKLNVSSIPDGVQKMVNPLKHINTLESETYPLLKTIENQPHFSKFCDALKGIVLLDDNLISHCTFWKTQLSSVFVLHNHLFTPADHPHHTVTVNVYNQYTDNLATFFHNHTVISQATATRSFLSVQEKIMSTDRFEILAHVIHCDCPHLGGSGYNRQW